MNSGCNIKNFILAKTMEHIEEMPKDVYALYFFINTNEGSASVPTLALMYNTFSELGEDEIEPIEPCWNIACWDTDEFPIIGNNVKDTDEAEKTMKMLSEWFASNGYDSSKQIHDPINDYFECTVGYRVLSELIEEIAPEVKKISKEKFGRDVVLLFGEYSYLPSDVKKIVGINGDEAKPFIQYYEESERECEEFNQSLIDGLNGGNDEEFDKVVSSFLEKIRKDNK